MRHIELKMLTVQGMAENGTTSHPHCIDSRQPSRHHDQSHDPRKTGQVRTCLELARINLHRLGPTCTGTTVTAITETLTVLKSTVNSSQNHRLTAHLGTTFETGSTMRKQNSSQPSAQNSDESARCLLELDGRCQHDRWYGRQLHDFTSKGDSAEHRHQFEGTNEETSIVSRERMRARRTVTTLRSTSEQPGSIRLPSHR